MVFVVGGNGGNSGANAINDMCRREQVHCAVIGIPKSIDNDILLVDRCFGFDTAVEESQRALQAARVEAMSANNGIGLVKLMGRSSGFIALQVSALVCLQCNAFVMNCQAASHVPPSCSAASPELIGHDLQQLDEEDVRSQV
jgi:6-phosphofructokinase